MREGKTFLPQRAQRKFRVNNVTVEWRYMQVTRELKKRLDSLCELCVLCG